MKGGNRFMPLDWKDTFVFTSSYLHEQVLKDNSAFQKVDLPKVSWGRFTGQKEDSDSSEAWRRSGHSSGSWNDPLFGHDVLCPGDHYTTLLCRQVQTWCSECPLYTWQKDVLFIRCSCWQAASVFFHPENCHILWNLIFRNKLYPKLSWFQTIRPPKCFFLH